MPQMCPEPCRNPPFWLVNRGAPRLHVQVVRSRECAGRLLPHPFLHGCFYTAQNSSLLFTNGSRVPQMCPVPEMCPDWWPTRGLRRACIALAVCVEFLADDIR